MSSTPATRLDVMNLQVISAGSVMVTVTIVTLQEQLDLKLQQRQARETGICQVRRCYLPICYIYCCKNKKYYAMAKIIF